MGVLFMPDLSDLISKFYGIGLPTYGRSLDAAAQVPMSKGTPQQINAMLLKYGAAPEELQRTGTSDLIANSGDRVRMDDVMGQLANNPVKMKDYVYADRSPADNNQLHDAAIGDIQGSDDLLKKYGDRYGRPGPSIDYDSPGLSEYLWNKGISSDPAAFSDYTTKGAKDTDDYVEHVLSSPGSGYTSPHFNGEYNLDAVPDYHSHMRYQTRDTADGKRMLLIDEMQSDLMQGARKRGFKGEPDPYMADAMRITFPSSDGWPVTYSISKDNVADQVKKLADSGIDPDQIIVHPFLKEDGPARPPLSDTKDYTKYLLKRAAQIGANKNVDQIGWTTGAQQARRYISGNADDAKRLVGMQNYYDKIVPSVSMSLIKKYGGKIGQSNIMKSIEDIPGYEMDGPLPTEPMAVHSFDLTPQMKEDLLTKGISLYREGGEVESNLNKYEEQSYG